MRVVRPNIFEKFGVTPCRFPIAGSVRCLVLGMAIMGVSSCALLKRGEATRDTFDITAPSQFDGVRKSRRSQILVKMPTALKSIDSERIILKPTATVVTYIAGAQWADTVPRLLQAKLIESFENSGTTRATAKPGDGLVIDFQLVSEIRRFEVFEDNAVIEISVKLLSDKSGRVRETRIFHASTRASSPETADYVAAFDISFDTIAYDMIVWVASRT